MADDKQVAVVNPGTGEAGYIDPKFLPDAARAGVQAASDRQLRAAQIEANQQATTAALNAQYSGTVEGAVAPVLAGAARGLTFGGSDVLASELGGADARRKLLDYQEYAPVASAVGEVGAIAGSALLGNEGGLSTLPGIVSRVGAGAEGMVARRLGSGVLGKVAGGALRGAAEGALYSQGKALSEAALHDEQMTAEKLVAAGWHGAQFGAAAGGAVGLLGAGVSGIANRLTGASREAPLVSAASDVASSKSGGVGGILRDAADRRTMSALGSTPSELRAIEKNVSGGVNRVAQDIRADIQAATGRSIRLHTRESIHEYAVARAKELGEANGAMMRKLDNAGTGVAPDISNFIRRVEAEVIEPNLTRLADGSSVVAPTKGPIVKAARKYIDEIKANFGEGAPSFEKWHQTRVDLQGQVNYNALKQSPKADAFKAMRRIAEDELETSAEAASKQMGESFLGEYRANKSLYQSVRKAADITERSVETSSPVLGLSTMIAGAAGVVSGGLGTGLLMGAVSKALKSNQAELMAADLLSRGANIMGVTTAVARSNAKLASGVSGLLGAAEEAGVAAAPKASGGFMSALLAGIGRAAKEGTIAAAAGQTSQRKEFTERASAISALTSNPAMLSERVGNMLGPVADASPGVAAATVSKVLGDLQFLQSKMPPSRTDPYSLQPQFQAATRASDSEISRHVRYVQAMDDPTIILKLAKNGTLTPDHVEAVKERYPRMYEEMRTKVLEGMLSSKSKVTYGRRIQLGMLLDIPTDKTLSPEFVSAIQATYEAKAPVEPTAPKMSGLDFSKPQMTGTQSATSR